MAEHEEEIKGINSRYQEFKKRLDEIKAEVDEIRSQLYDNNSVDMARLRADLNDVEAKRDKDEVSQELKRKYGDKLTKKQIESIIKKRIKQCEEREKTLTEQLKNKEALLKDYKDTITRQLEELQKIDGMADKIKNALISRYEQEIDSLTKECNAYNKVKKMLDTKKDSILIKSLTVLAKLNDERNKKAKELQELQDKKNRTPEEEQKIIDLKERINQIDRSEGQKDEAKIKTLETRIKELEDKQKNDELTEIEQKELTSKKRELIIEQGGQKGAIEAKIKQIFEEYSSQGLKLTDEELKTIFSLRLGEGELDIGKIYAEKSDSLVKLQQTLDTLTEKTAILPWKEPNRIDILKEYLSPDEKKNCNRRFLGWFYRAFYNNVRYKSKVDEEIEKRKKEHDEKAQKASEYIDPDKKSKRAKEAEEFRKKYEYDVIQGYEERLEERSQQQLQQQFQQGEERD